MLDRSVLDNNNIRGTALCLIDVCIRIDAYEQDFAVIGAV